MIVWGLEPHWILSPGPWDLIAFFHRQGTTVFKKMAAPLKPTLSFRKSNTVAKRISKEKDDSKISHITRSFKENICCRLIWVPSRQQRQRPFLSLRCSSLCVVGTFSPILASRGPWGWTRIIRQQIILVFLIRSYSSIYIIHASIQLFGFTNMVLKILLQCEICLPILAVELYDCK